MATGTSQNFTFDSGTWKNNGYSAIIDDESNSSTGKIVNGLRQWEWDMPDVGGGRLYQGSNNWIVFIPGTDVDNGTWYNSSTSVITTQPAGSRTGRVITLSGAVFTETNAFVNGVVPCTNPGPTVTSITRNESTNLITVLHTGTLTSSDVNHTISNVSSSITNLQTITNGSTFTASGANGTHVIRIGDEILTYFIYNTTNARQTLSSNNNLVVTFPTTDNNWLSNFSGYDSEVINTIVYTTTKTHVNFAKNASRNYYVFVTFNLSYNATQEGFSVLTQIYDYENSSASNNWAYSYSSTLQWVYPEATFESTGSADTLITLPTNDIVDSFNWNFASVSAPVTTTSNGGGKPDRYPLIMTNLFNRNRSLYSIGMTHKDTWDLFL